MVFCCGGNVLIAALRYYYRDANLTVADGSTTLYPLRVPSHVLPQLLVVPPAALLALTPPPPTASTAAAALPLPPSSQASAVSAPSADTKREQCMRWAQELLGIVRELCACTPASATAATSSAAQQQFTLHVWCRNTWDENGFLIRRLLSLHKFEL
jgi:hypothetical protein